MKFGIKIIALFGFGFVSLVYFAPVSDSQTETAGQRFKSIKVLTDMPADQMGKVMNMMSASLGVKCGFCHASDDGDYEKEGFEHKDIARQMLKMTFELNKNYFEGKLEVNCNTCHQGKAHPRHSFPLAPPVKEEQFKRPDKKPAAEDLVDRFLDKIGGRPFAKARPLRIKAVRVEPDGITSEPEEIWLKGENVLTQTTYGDYVVRELFDGKTAQKFGNSTRIDLKSDEAEQIKREAQILSGKLKSAYEKMDFRRLELIEGREVYRVDAITADNHADRLYFDVETGLLVRRSAATPTVLGFHVFQVDYLDYRNFGGITLPATVKYAMPQIYWTRKILSVQANANIDDRKFKIN